MSIVTRANATVGTNNFNWTGFTSISLVKLPVKRLTVLTDSGQKVKLTKFTKVCLLSLTIIVLLSSFL